MSEHSAVQAIRSGDVPALRRLLASDPALATARLDGSRTLLHVATDWPGHFPNVAETIAALATAGADVNAPFGADHADHADRADRATRAAEHAARAEHADRAEHGERGDNGERGGAYAGHAETPLHWAASSDDVEALDALLDADADIEARGAVIAGGTALADAVAFAQWGAARRLVARGAAVEPRHAAALGLLDQVTVSDQGEVRPGLLVRLPRRSASRGGAVGGAGRHGGLGAALGAPDAPGRGRAPRLHRRRHLATRPGRPLVPGPLTER